MVKKDTALVKKATEALAPWEQEEAQHARDVKSKETLGIPRIQTRGAKFSIDGKALGTSLVVLPIAAAKEKSYYVEDFNPAVPATPECYALADDTLAEADMVAHAAARDKQNLQPDGSSPCQGCKHNAFNTAKKGKGKRCKDYRRWLVISPVLDEKTGRYNLDAAAVQKAEKRQLSIPPSSLKAYGAYLSSLNDKTRTGSVREMMVKLDIYNLPNGGHGFTFEPVQGVDSETFQAVRAIGNAAAGTLLQPYPDLGSNEEAGAAQAKAKKMSKRVGK